uniref:ATP synthase subunit a n=1 Tax=Euciroa cf. queenslandica STW-2017 TaxID=1969321 RepID=A0A1U9XPE8_9BIVA|nr:ATP synthase F0 subunit 6 [Euciroa cf. queenslandica STW-2017]AQZ26125.1 ATP synthase subunit 6 [Euciroa cf. queenslandica STW-2017]
MFTDLFSMFDVSNFSNWSMAKILWFDWFICVIVLCSLNPWGMFSRFDGAISQVLSFFWSSFNFSHTPSHGLGGFPLFISSIFFTVLFMNMEGACPYVFSWTGQLVVVISITLPAWLSLFVTALLYSTMDVFGRYAIRGGNMTSSLLGIPLEVISDLVRPLSLSLRLMVNIVTGHITGHFVSEGLDLMMKQEIVFNMNILLMFLCFMLMAMYCFIEFFAGFIQAYVLSALLSSYINGYCTALEG